MTSSRPMSIASSDATITGTCSDSDSIDERLSFDYDSINVCPPVDYDSVDKRSSVLPADYSNFSQAFTRDSFSLEELHDFRILITDELIRFARSNSAANEADRIRRLRLYSRVKDLFSTLYMHQLGPPMELRRALIQAKGKEEKKKDKEMIVFHKEVEAQSEKVTEEYVSEIKSLVEDQGM
ncbi:uncharacterized protein PGTG_19050 [Puccinia graminis f. sp. tritici CRL 75-36-700-3]|uniref:Uncharacterized protein n=1 Tax=Puccinia graminis f. sp. tritici (strain CRL 75-36-700-3 / race SCCL) TaxID=418459 RepID=E3L8P6_PUCGT|nr:uncharacterized protein PGTG_19050 [Puccinia graminis f. sp. tritici CRL 75-36-700-3]EFP92932.2 hypothetical protein PGTG_19050 [Puccinia graminis f. sp. tritici CRL 75-36-700-3]